jgi:glutathione synthase/RimK-type ligase-like ATP-grasp enzyme
MTYYLLPYKAGSASAKALASVLGAKRIKLEGSSFQPGPSKVVINWGSTSPPGPLGESVLNPPDVIKKASNKLTFFQTVKGAECDKIIPPFWASASEIPPSVFDGDGMVVCRTVLAGHSGAGIVLASSPEEVVAAPLYTLYLKKKDEYRLHFGKKADGSSTCFIVQRKAKKNGAENVDWKIRNHQNGFVYVRDGVVPPDVVVQVADKAFSLSGLDFGAIDVIYNENAGKAYVLEINTAPGLEGQSVTDYATFFMTRGG